MTRTSLTQQLMLALVLGISLSANAQYIQVGTNPMSLLFGVYKVEAEVPLAPRWAIEPEFAVLSEGQRFWSQDYDTKGLRAGASIKRYFSPEGDNTGFYGFAYYRNSAINFTDNVELGEQIDQRPFKRVRNTFGFGAGYTFVGRDGFYINTSFGLGRHANETRTYGPLPESMALVGEELSQALDETIFTTPLDVYGKIGVGVRFFAGGNRNRQLEELEYED